MVAAAFCALRVLTVAMLRFKLSVILEYALGDVNAGGRAPRNGGEQVEEEGKRAFVREKRCSG